MPDRSPRTLWETALGQLELEVTRPNFDTWLRGTVGLRIADSQFVVGVPSDFAIEWLKSRLHPLISRTISQLLGGPISVSFEVLGVQPASARLGTNGRQPNPISQPLSLDPHLTFDSFTVVESNRLAYRAARRVASGENGYNPLVLCGPPGLGKTHLLHAIAHQATRAGQQVALLSGESFVNRYAATVRAGHPHTFLDPFQSCDLLLLDDLQFLATRPGSQAQFLVVFNTLHSAQRHVVLTTDTPPHTLQGLSPHLRSRLHAGLTIELGPPPPAERLEILRALASHLSQPPPDTALQLIADQPHDHIRALQGALNRVIAYAELTGSPLSHDAISRVLQPTHPATRSPSPDTILKLVSTHFHFTPADLAGASRARDVTYARHIAMYFLRYLGLRGPAQIGTLLGNRDHSTVLNGCRRIKRERSALPQTNTDLQQIEEALQQHPAA